MAKKKVEENSFEYSYRRIGEIVDELESSIEEKSLEEIISAYQEGLTLLKICREKLEEAELKIEKINSQF